MDKATGDEFGEPQCNESTSLGGLFDQIYYVQDD
jgi:hypothetical protein